MNTLETGGSVGRYRIVGFLGAGAMGEVYLAEDPHIERKLAIKTVRLAGRAQEVEERTRRLLREARAAGRLLHPHVVTLFDAGETDGMLYLAFEFVEGSDLAARLETSALSLYEVMRIGRETAEALDFAHRHGIVHRDVKPSNILLDTQGRVKVTDFGIAKVTGQSTELTVAGSVMGSPQYLSPEQIRGEELDGRSDIFSLGVVLYELLSGKRPFDGDTITTLVYQILHKDPPPISTLRGDLPPRVETLLNAMLAKDSAERLATAGLVAEELAAIERELPEETLAGPAAGNTERFIPTRVLPESYSTGMARAATAAGEPVGQAAAAAPAAPVAAAPAAARQGRGLGLWLALIAVVLAAAVGGGWVLMKKLQVGKGGGEEVAGGVAMPQAAAGAESAGTRAAGADGAQPAAPASAAPTSGEQTASGTGNTAIGVAGAPQPSSPPGKPLPGPIGQPIAQRPPIPPPGAGEQAARREERLERPAPTPSQASRGAAAIAPPTAAVPDRAAAEVPVRTVAPAPTAAEPAPDSSPADERPAVDRQLNSGLFLAFRVTPPDAHVLLGRTVIGRAEDYSGVKGKKPYQLPGPGEHLIRLRKPGMREMRIGVVASEAGSTTQVVARLEPIPSAQVATQDLQTYRVREAIALRVEPPGALVSVDGRPMGQAAQYKGRMGRADEWLVLTPGTHRVTLTAPGFRGREIAVEVTGGAEKVRDKIEVRLAPGGQGEG